VKAEIAKMNVYPGSGHCYLDLVEKQERETKAQFRGVIWATDFGPVSEKFRKATGRELGGGLSVLVFARINYHPVYGLSLWISDLEPSFTLGEMERLRQAAITRLKEENLFSLNHRLQVPAVPQRLAVISASSSKGYADFLSILNASARKYRFHVTLFSAFLQGDRAVESIVNRLSEIESKKEDFDMLLVIRGGGDEIGMTCFDQEELARRICLFPLPVITGIGHSTNETVTEMVACRNKITPTDVAYFILALMDEFTDSLDLHASRIALLARQQLDRKGENMTAVSQRLNSMVRGRLKHEETLVAHLGEKMMLGLKHFLGNRHAGLDAMESKVSILDPVRTFKRGYSLTMKADGTPVLSSGEVTPGETLITRLSAGSLKSIVEQIELPVE
jgi:exodeoxyribonuclease VII large subunit